jgi:alpha-N-arabinofuranosidase
MKSGTVVYSSLTAATCIALVTCLAGALTHHHASSGSVSLAVGKDGGNKSSPLLYGMMFEVRNLISFSLQDHLSFLC